MIVSGWIWYYMVYTEDQASNSSTNECTARCLLTRFHSTVLQCTGRFSEMMSPLPGGRGFGGRGFRGSPHQHFSPNFRGGRGNSPNFRGGFRGRGGGPPPSPFMMQGHPGFRGHSPNYRGGRPGGGHRGGGGRGGGGSDQVIL